MRQIRIYKPSLISSFYKRGLDRRNIAFSLLVSSVFPPFLLYAASKSSSFRQQHWLLTLFVGWYAVCLPVALDPLGAGPDGVRHLLAVYVYYVDMSFEQFIADLWDILLFNGAPGSNDVFKHVISYFVGSLVGIPELFFPMVGLFYGYFFVGSMLIIFRNLGKNKLPWVIIVLGLCFFLTRNIESLQAVRNPTAGWVLIYGILRFQETKRPRYIFLMACAPLVHFSFLLIAFPAFAFLVIGNRPTLYVVLFLLSAPVNLVTPEAAMDLVSQVEIGEQKVLDRSEQGRSDLEARALEFERQMQGGTRLWRAYMMAGYQKIALNALVFGLIISGAYFRMDKFSQNCFSNGLLMLAASNSLWFLDGATGRLWGVGFLLVMAGFLVWRLGPEFSLKRIVWPQGYILSCYISAALFVPYLLFCVSRLLDFINVFIFAFPWLVLTYPELNITIKEVLRFIIPF